MAIFLITILVGCDAAISMRTLPDAGLQESEPDGESPVDLEICLSNDECGGGICHQGTCCASQDQVCGAACCAASEVCFANACVAPGKLCSVPGDCGENQYCEPELGPESSGPPMGNGATGQVCLAVMPKEGRCLDLPPRCADGDLGEDGSCLSACTFKPDKDVLEPVVKWQWGPRADTFEDFTDVWSTPVVARIYDTNCDGVVNELDPPNVVVVSGDAKGTCCSCGGFSPSTCQTGVLRLLDGASGKEIWSLRGASPESIGFAGLTSALGDMDLDGHIDIVAVTGEGHVVVIDAAGQVVMTSDQPIPGASANNFGWGGALAIADMDTDGFPEVAYDRTVFTTKDGELKLLFTGEKGTNYISTFVDLDNAPDGHLELLVGRTAYKSDGTELWHQPDLPNGFPGVGDFNRDGNPEVVLVSGGKVWIMEGATGEPLFAPFALPGGGSGGPPTIADFDSAPDGLPEIGVAMKSFYSVIKPDFVAMELTLLWQAPNHDLSSSVTGSTVFDFEGDGEAEVIYNDECFLWVYDGKTGAVRFATPTTSFTATEASLVADISGDGRAELLMVSNGANPSDKGWKCNMAPWNQADPETGRPAWVPPKEGDAYRGLTLWGSKSKRWVGTRSLWNQHTYHVSNICDHRDSACEGTQNTYGAIPRREKKNWTIGWLNNFRQNVQDKGVFDAPDATVSLRARCGDNFSIQAWVRNAGLALLPAGVEVGFYVQRGGEDVLLSTAVTDRALYPGQAHALIHQARPEEALTDKDTFVAKIHLDPDNLPFHECRADNNASAPVKAVCFY